MSKLILCSKHQEMLPALASAPFQGKLGETIAKHVSQKAWDEWLEEQTRMINELNLNLGDKADRQKLSKLRQQFLNLPT